MKPVNEKYGRNILLAALLVGAGLLLSACSTGSYGHLDFTLTVSDIFESGQVLDDHHYYYIGPEAEPVAVMGIDNKYELAPSLWKPVNLTPEKLRAWMDRIDNRYRFRNMYDGAYILDQDGNRVGIWYSRLDWTTIRRGEGNQLIVYTPDTTQHLDNPDKADFLGN